MGQPARLELAPRRWQRRALPVELCLPCLCHIPSCKRTIRLFPVALPERRRSSFASAKKSGTPPGIRTRNFMFLRHARIPIPPAGQTKSPGTLRRTRASRESGRNSSLAASFGPDRARGRIAERTRVRLPLAAYPRLQSRVKHFNPHRCCRSYANAAVPVALTSKTKKPGALSRSGLVETRQL